jgi:hypothetical protein
MSPLEGECREATRGVTIFHMGFFSSKKPTSYCTLIADISPNSIGLGVAEIKAGKTTLIYTNREYISYAKAPTLDQMSTKISALLKNMLLVVRKKYVLTKSCVVHSSAWSISGTHTVDMELPKPIKADEKFVMEEIAKHRTSKIAQEGLTLVYYHIQRVRLNGYVVVDPWGKLAQHISCDVVQASIDTKIKNLIDDILLPSVHDISHIPESIATLNAVRYLVPDMNKTLLVHIGGETTEVVYGGIDMLAGSGSTPAGIYTVLRALEKTTGHDTELAFSHLIMSIRESRLPTQKEQTLIENSFEEWRKKLYRAMHAVCGNNAMPQDIVVFAVPHYMPIAMKLMDSKKLTLWTGRDHHVVNILDRNNSNFLIPTNVGIMHDFMIAVGAFYVVQ